MGGIYGNEPMFQVRWWHANGDERGGACRGPRAFSEASDLFEQAKRDEQARLIWFTRLDGGEWVWVEKPIIRDADGTWRQAKPGEDIP